VQRYLVKKPGFFILSFKDVLNNFNFWKGVFPASKWSRRSLLYTEDKPMQKKLTCAIRNVLAAAVVTGSSFAAHAADGTINFTGEVVDSACTVDTSTASQTVNLGKVLKSAFTGVGQVAAATRFNIVLNNCPSSLPTVTVKFDGTANANDSDILALNSDQTAQGVGVALYEEDGVTPIPLATQSKSITLDTTSTGSPAVAANSNTLTFVAKYKATQQTIVAGTANATSDFTISYQ